MRSTAVAAALAACAVPMAACSASAPERGFTPAGVIVDDPSSSGDAAGAGQTPAVETIAAGPGLQVRIEWPAALEADQAGMVRAFGDSYAGQWKAVGSLGKDRSYLDGVEDPASRDAYAWVDGFLRSRRSARGVAELYALRVASVSGRGAEIDGCVDESGIRVVDRSGDEIAEQPSWTRAPASVYFQAAAVRKGDDGAWRVKLFQHADYPDERAKECVR
ncbi:hypothetical protein GCM10009530_51790 [Microbispora corallina]|uniref:Lipoprotein n=1 Tax=Microbispora corallina TaxID=83302 RepID=A0ABQ4G6X9_9ACTN|nr:hypothetical protein [Microbispora corallina]GIH42772.1 hypothetical protein Mco01_57720 [Microbispora corallina]